MDKADANYISVIGHRLVGPIFTILDRLLAEPHPGSNDVQTGARENGYSLAACLLVVVLLESLVTAARIRSTKTLPREARRPLDFLRSTYPDCPSLGDVEELFVLRDVIAHNHIWHIQFETDIGSWMTLLGRALDETSGDSKFANVVDAEKALTRRLKLKVLPTTIDRYDVAVAFSVVVSTLRYLAERGDVVIDNLRAPLGDKILSIEEAEQWFKCRTSR